MCFPPTLLARLCYCVLKRVRHKFLMHINHVQRATVFVLCRCEMFKETSSRPHHRLPLLPATKMFVLSQLQTRPPSARSSARRLMTPSLSTGPQRMSSASFHMSFSTPSAPDRPTSSVSPESESVQIHEKSNSVSVIRLELYSTDSYSD